MELSQRAQWKSLLFVDHTEVLFFIDRRLLDASEETFLSWVALLVLPLMVVVGHFLVVVIWMLIC